VDALPGGVGDIGEVVAGEVGEFTLYSRVHRMDVLRRAWAGVCANGGAPGVDGMTVDAVAASGVDVFLQHLAERLRTYTYRPSVLRRVQIPNRGGRGSSGRCRFPPCRTEW
jgi:retron-type reverse transcriptase